MRKQDYVYALLTGYVDPPPGVEIREGLNYNPYFPGGAIGMARVLYDGLVEFEDGTPATTSQMAKDVVTFLAWASEPELDQRKKMGMQASIILTGLLAMSIWVKKFKWAGIKSRKLVCASPLVFTGARRKPRTHDSASRLQTTRLRSSTECADSVLGCGIGGDDGGNETGGALFRDRLARPGSPAGMVCRRRRSGCEFSGLLPMLGRACRG